MRNLLLSQILLPNDVMPSGRWMGLTFKEVLILFGALGGVTLMAVLWAVYFRKVSRRHSQHHHHHHSPGSEPAVAPESDSSISGSGVSGDRRYRRKRRRRRDHRPRNPTLAETGGLPPLRPEQPPDPLP